MHTAFAPITKDDLLDTFTLDVSQEVSPTYTLGKKIITNTNKYTGPGDILQVSDSENILIFNSGAKDAYMRVFDEKGNIVVDSINLTKSSDTPNVKRITHLKSEIINEDGDFAIIYRASYDSGIITHNVKTFNKDGLELSSVISETLKYGARVHDIEALVDGSYATSWQHKNGKQFIKVFHEDGTSSDGEYSIPLQGVSNTGVVNISKLNEDGDFVVTYESSYKIVSERFDINGKKIPGGLTITETGNTNSTIAYDEINTLVKSDGSYVVSAQAKSTTGNNSSVYVQNYNSDGELTKSFVLDIGGNDYSPVSSEIGNEGNYVIIWYGKYALHSQMFDKDGNELSTPIRIDSANVQYADVEIINITNSTDYVLSYTNNNNIYVQKFSEDGQKIGEPIIMNHRGQEILKDIEQLDDGTLLVTWTARSTNSTYGGNTETHTQYLHENKDLETKIDYVITSNNEDKIDYYLLNYKSGQVSVNGIDYPSGSKILKVDMGEIVLKGTSYYDSKLEISAESYSNDKLKTLENTDLEIDVSTLTQNDEDLDGTLDLSTFTIIKDPIHGIISYNTTTQKLTYVPDAGYNGTDSFSYTIKDNDGLVSNESVVDLKIAASYTPLIVDLNGDGVNTINISDGVEFDIDSDGDKDKTGWVDKHDGLLVRDINLDGIINNSKELFGESTIKEDGSKAKDGFDALSDLDSNYDDVINSSDQSYHELKVWQDKNSDGISQQDEILSLLDAGISEINLNYENTNIDNNGNNISLKSTFTSDENQIGEIADVLFEFEENQEDLLNQAVLNKITNSTNDNLISSVIDNKNIKDDEYYDNANNDSISIIVNEQIDVL